MNVVKLILSGLVSVLLAGPVVAQNYPSRPIKVIVPFAPGTGTDTMARTIADAINPILGQPLIVENRSGAGGTVGAAAVASAMPDGYTLLVHSAGHTTNPAIYKTLPYDTVNDFASVAMIAIQPNVLIIGPNNKGIKTVQDLVAYGKANPGKLTYGSAGVGSGTQMNAEKFRASAGFDAVHVPYRGSTESFPDIMTGRTDFFFSPVSAALGLIKDGKLLALGVSTAKRSVVLPDVPTTIEAGVPDSEFALWYAMFAPKNTPREIVVRLHEAVGRALASTEFKNRMAAVGADPWPMTPDQLTAHVRAEVAINMKLAIAAGIKPE